ncbi:GNAT family N-acetyltransferase [Paenibacillus popilliae]|uniref:N-acetyltransferase n=1 Tax=Paenibacillus popilliae TaxID=78057 RepID=A0ABY3ATI6_PAEPP|nr:GNAT family protein [Paenibacillus sp. SDF0028]TQR46020.1 N-acetyltransferase [Paenibacillus sp. SDF0028]
MFIHKINDDIQLKILEIRDANELFLLSDKNREYLREWLPWVDRTVSVGQTKEYIQFSLKLFAENNGFNLAIFYKSRIAGCIGLHSIDWSNRKTSIGYWLGEEYQGNGAMTSACKALINYIFNDLALNRVEIRAAVLNTKSRAIPERLGFLNEGTVRQAEWLYDHFVDHVVYGMLKEEWNKEVK